MSAAGSLFRGIERTPGRVPRQEEQEPRHVTLPFDDLDVPRQRGLPGHHRAFGSPAADDPGADIESEGAAIAPHRLDPGHHVEPRVVPGALDLEGRESRHGESAASSGSMPERGIRSTRPRPTTPSFRKGSTDRTYCSQSAGVAFWLAFRRALAP